MPTFTYSARDPNTGSMHKAEIEAQSEQAALKIIGDRGLVPLEIKESKQRTGIQDLLHRIPVKQKVIFSRQMATLINAGLPLVQSLNTVKGQTPNKKLKLVIERVINEVEGGSTLADALAQHPKVFNEVYVSLVAAGETSGTLDKSLERLANQQEKDNDIVTKLRGAMVYPFLVIIVLVGVVLFLLTTVLPRVQELYESLPGTTLPLITRFFLATSQFVMHYWWILLLLSGAAVFFTLRWAQTPPGKHMIDRLKIRSPMVGSLFLQVYMARFARTSATLVASGVPMIKMLSTTSKSINNLHVEASILKAIEQVNGGTALSDSLSGDPYFLELVPNMIKIGEQSGQLEGMLEKLADYYEKEVDNKIKNISTTIEPILMIIVGIMALIVVAAVLLPIYSLAGKNLVPSY